MFGALGQHQNLSPLIARTLDFCRNGRRASGIGSQVPEHILNPDIGGEVELGKAHAGHHLQIMGRAGRLHCQITDRPALHEDDRLLAIPANGRSREGSGSGGISD